MTSSMVGAIEPGIPPERIVTKGGIVLHLAQCDFYTMIPPDDGLIAIL